MSREIYVLPDTEGLARRAAEIFAQTAAEAVKARGVFSVALCGGNTPRALYALLAEASFRRRIPWRKSHFFWGDERRVPPEHPDSNYGLAQKTLLGSVPVPPSNVHRIWAELPDADEAAARYERVLREHFKLPAGRPPRFDLVLLGLGADGHTASLFPGSPALDDKCRLVRAVWVEKLKAHRITLALPVINNASNVLFMVNGKDKAAAARQVLEGADHAKPLPAGLVKPAHGRLYWLLDSQAASLLG